MTDPRVTLAGVEFNCPAFTASGCAAAGRELASFFDLTEIGGVVTKSIMLRPRSGRPTPRMVETPSGMLNSIGLQGPESSPSSPTTSPGYARTTWLLWCPSPARPSTTTASWLAFCATSRALQRWK